MTGNKVVSSLTNVSPRVYKDSTLLGAYYGPPPTPLEPISSSFCMLQASQAAHKRSGMPSQQPTPL